MGSPLIPSVDSLIRSLDDGRVPRRLLARVVKNAVHRASGDGADPTPDGIGQIAAGMLDRLWMSRPSKVVNATGVLLHTNLGRAPWSSAAVALATVAASSYGNVELDRSSGGRGTRGEYVHELLVELSGAEAAFIVNNNAAAVFLTLSVLAGGRSVPVSRGELIEIGGSYRLPDLMRASGVRLVEVGTTNRTRVGDFASAVDETTGMLLKVHPSNYRVEGFTEEASVSELAQLARRVEVPFVVDVGSGLLDQETPWLTEHPPAWLAGEPGVRQTLKAGADLVLFSGDKLLGGPQAGMIVGREDLITRLVASPIARALRQDGVALAGLASTLEAYADRRVMEIPLWKMAAVSYDSLERRAMRVVDDAAVDASVVAGVSAMGGGTVPGMEIPSPVIELHGPADQVFAALLAHTPTVLARRVRGKVLVDLRAVEPEDDHILAKAISGACQ
jgi:L-seryl-tRNA(Ser) seleniumtransferase